MKVLEFIRNINYEMPVHPMEMVSSDEVKEYIEELRILFGCHDDDDFISDLITIYPVMFDSLDLAIRERSHWPIMSNGPREQLKNKWKNKFKGKYQEMYFALYTMLILKHPAGLCMYSSGLLSLNAFKTKYLEDPKFNKVNLESRHLHDDRWEILFTYRFIIVVLSAVEPTGLANKGSFTSVAAMLAEGVKYDNGGKASSATVRRNYIFDRENNVFKSLALDYPGATEVMETSRRKRAASAAQASKAKAKMIRLLFGMKGGANPPSPSKNSSSISRKYTNVVIDTASVASVDIADDDTVEDDTIEEDLDDI